MYTQGHFFNKSIEQSKYTIFMSQCILELKYTEGTRKIRLWRSGSLGGHTILCLLVSLKCIWGCIWDPQPHEKSEKTKQRYSELFEIQILPLFLLKRGQRDLSKCLLTIFSFFFILLSLSGPACPPLHEVKLMKDEFWNCCVFSEKSLNLSVSSLL